jgi:2,4-dienoyl-CoA reductase-like NADH-dependent reductase (Old Yellow Enzyme family)
MTDVAPRVQRLSVMFEPLTIRGLTVANRFVMSPANRNASPGGVPGEDIAQYFRRRVDGEVGLIVAGGVGVDHPASVGAGANRPCAIPVLHGAAIPGWRRIVELVEVYRSMA